MVFNSERFRITCCKDCPDRYPGCHGKCEKYIAERAAYDAQKAKAMKVSDLATGLYEQKCNGVDKATRYRNYRSKYRKGR